MNAPNKQERQIVLDPRYYEKRESPNSYTEVAQNLGGKFIDNQSKNGDSQYVAGYLLVCLTFLAAFRMFLSYKSGSPTAKAEKDLKLDLINEMSLFKETLNNETGKRNRFVDSRLNNLDLSIAKFDKDMVHNTEAIHDLQRDNRERYDTIIKLLSSQKT